MNVAIFQEIAKAYEKLPSGKTGDLETERSYAAFRDEIIRLYKAIPARVESWEAEGQPYHGSPPMFEDLDRNRRLFVFTGGDEHPFLTRTENVMFRAVHDYFGHYLGRYSFGPRGEFQAWKAHCGQFIAEAIPALTAETLGQNCWVNFGPFSYLPPAERPYAEQKAGLLPEELYLPLIAQPGGVPAFRLRPLMRFPGL